MFFFFFLIINPIEELLFPIGMPIKEAKTEIEIHPVIVDAKIRNCSKKFRVVQTFLCILLINSFCFISSRK